jgi:branched-chain amino acid transport system permease protein
MAVGALGGIALGLPATRLRGPYLAGMTLAFGYVMTPFIQSLGSWTGGSGGLYFPVLVTPTWFTSMVGESENLIGANARYQAVLSIFVAGVALFFAANLSNSRVGRAMRLVRDDDVAAELVGVNLARTRVTAFAVSAALAALGGSLLALVAGAATSSTYGVALSIELLSLLVLGGMGSISGAILAGILAAYTDVIMTKISSFTGIDPFSNVGANMKGIIFGVVLITMMLAAPLGLVGLAKSLFAKVKRLFIPAS